MTEWVDEPYVLTGVSGSATIPALGSTTTARAAFTASFPGSLTVTLDVDGTTFEVYDDDDDLIQDDTDGTLGVVLQDGTYVEIQATNPVLASPGATISWTYAERASSVLQIALDNTDVLVTPGAMEVNLSNGTPSDVVTFSFIGPTSIDDFASITLDEIGAYGQYAIPLPELQAGNYVLRAESVHSGSTDSDFTVVEDPLSSTVHTEVDSTPPTLSVQRWTFYDPRNPDDTWTLQRNPKSWSTMIPPNTFTETPTVAPDGQTLTYEAGSRPWRMEFTGFIDDEDEYNRFVFWSGLRRRLWLIDHRGRTWLLTIEDFDATALIKPNLPWAHDYTAKTVIFKQGTD